MDIIRTIKPTASRRFLLFTAAVVWTFAGAMLLFRGYLMSAGIKTFFRLKILLSLSGGALFYLLLFSKISLSHVRRIINLENDRPCVFSFFSVKSYIMMIIMITSGILLRTSGIVRPEYLSLVYITMGIPLLVSAYRFYYNGITYR